MHVDKTGVRAEHNEHAPLTAMTLTAPIFSLLSSLALMTPTALQQPFGRRQGMNVAIRDAAADVPLSKLQQHLYSFQPGGPRNEEVVGGGSPILSEQCRQKLSNSRRTLRVHLRSERKGDLAMGNKYVNAMPARCAHYVLHMLIMFRCPNLASIA